MAEGNKAYTVQESTNPYFVGVVGTSSGIHAWHNSYYIRRMQCTKDEKLYRYLVKNHPSLVKDMTLIPNSAVIEIPQKAPEDAITRNNETATSMLNRVNKWI